MAEKRCINCGENGEPPSRYPHHRARECPYERRDSDGQPWKDPNRVTVTLLQANPGLATGPETPAETHPSHIRGVDPDDDPDLPPHPDMPSPAQAVLRQVARPSPGPCWWK